MEYGPAPESAAPANAWLDAHERALRHVHRRPVDRAGRRAGCSTASTRPTASRSPGSPRRPQAEVDAAVAAARARLRRLVAGMPGHARARYLYALARQVQKHSRLLAVLETLDNGKPIRETRDIDIPLVARHFYHHAGWAQLMETRAARLRAARRGRADHPVELPAADAGVEDRAGAGDGQHGRAQAGRVHLAHRAAVRRDLRRRSACRRAWSTSSPATARRAS